MLLGRSYLPKSKQKISTELKFETNLVILGFLCHYTNTEVTDLYYSGKFGLFLYNKGKEQFTWNIQYVLNNTIGDILYNIKHVLRDSPYKSILAPT